MKQNRILISCIIMVLASLCLFSPLANGQTAIPESLSYQGWLEDPANPGQPLTGSVDLEFRIYDADDNVLWGPQAKTAVAVENGTFTVALDSSTGPISDAFQNSGERYLGIRVNGGNESRHLLSTAPFAFQVQYADEVEHADTAESADRVAYAPAATRANRTLGLYDADGKSCYLCLQALWKGARRNNAAVISGFDSRFMSSCVPLHWIEGEYDGAKIRVDFENRIQVNKRYLSRLVETTCPTPESVPPCYENENYNEWDAHVGEYLAEQNLRIICGTENLPPPYTTMTP